MNGMKEKKLLQDLLKTENEQLKKLNQLVSSSIDEESLITGKILKGDDDHYTFGERTADKVASFGGSWHFIIFFFLILACWIGINAWLLTRPFDPYPFILLNLILSCLAAIQAPVIMMSQNRKEAKDRKRAEEDYVVNLKAEIEIRNLHQKVDMLMLEQMKNLFEIQKVQCDLLEQLHQKLQEHLAENNGKSAK
jgi:uncharacterized membrane protein